MKLLLWLFFTSFVKGIAVPVASHATIYPLGASPISLSLLDEPLDFLSLQGRSLTISAIEITVGITLVLTDVEGESLLFEKSGLSGCQNNICQRVASLRLERNLEFALQYIEENRKLLSYSYTQGHV
jgi:hypothetical protein